MKKKILTLISVVVALAMSATMLYGCSSSSGDDEFVVGFDQSFPPYGFVDDSGEFAGLDLDLAAEVAKRNGWEVVYMPIAWDAKDAELDSGSIDCIWNGFTMEGREGGYEFTEPYMENTQVIVVKKSSGITNLAGLEGMDVTAQTDSAALHLLEEGGDQAALAATFGKLQSVADYQSAFLDLESDAVDAIAMDLPVARFQIEGKEDMYLILEDDPLSTEHYAVGFKLGNTELRDQVQKTLKEMVADGTVEEICKKYADKGVNYQNWCLKP